MTTHVHSRFSCHRFIRASAATGGPQVESFHAPGERLARQPEALRRTADIAARLAQAGFDHLPARVLGVPIPAAGRGLPPAERRRTGSPAHVPAARRTTRPL